MGRTLRCRIGWHPELKSVTTTDRLEDESGRWMSVVSTQHWVCRRCGKAVAQGPSDYTQIAGDNSRQIMAAGDVTITGDRFGSRAGTTSKTCQHAGCERRRGHSGAHR